MAEEPGLPKIPRIVPPTFSLDPVHAGGRGALTGFEFQDRYISFVLAGFVAGKEDFVAGRIEAVEDLDVLIRREEVWIERYYQIKSKEEGTGTWTILGIEDVTAKFFRSYLKFQLQRLAQRREIEFVVVAEGDLQQDLVDLRDRGSSAKDVKIKLFASLCASEATGSHSHYQHVKGAIRDWCQRNATTLLRGDGHNVWESSDSASLIEEVSTQTARPKQEVEQDLRSAIDHVAPMLEAFVASLRFESRVGRNLEEATLGRLLDCGDLSPEEARTALDKLMTSIREESHSPEPTTIDRSVLRSWLGVPERTLLQPKPELGPDTIRRTSALDDLSGSLEKEPVVLLYGLPKIGKSQLVSGLIERNQKVSDYFWFTFSGDPSDHERLLRQLSTWIGQRTSRWQLRDDVYAGLLQPNQVVDRMRNAPIRGVYIVFDDCHRATDKKLFEPFLSLVGQTWSDSRLILISEAKIPELAALGTQSIPIHGFEPNEAVEFVARLGLDLSQALVEFAMLSLQLDGHPVMMRVVAGELSRRPSASEVVALGRRLPSVQSSQDFLKDLSNRIFFNLLRTDDQRVWLARLGAWGFSFTRGLALEIAKLDPPLSIDAPDWNYLSSLILDQTTADHYCVPTLLRQVATAPTHPDSKAIMVAGARYIFRTAIASRQVDFWDFQHAIFALIAAGRDEEAAVRFIYSYPSFMQIESFEPFELVFLVLNGKPVHEKLADPFTRWLLLQAELYLRLQGRDAVDYAKAVALLKRTRILTHGIEERYLKAHVRLMVHASITSARVRKLKDEGSTTERESWRAFVPLQTALRLAVREGNLDLVSEVLKLYGHLYVLATKPDVELLKSALLSFPNDQALPLSGQALITLYTKYVIGLKHGDFAMQVVLRHSEDYVSAGRNDAYFACQHAAATIEHDGLSKYRDARERILPLYLRAADLKLSRASVSRAELFIGDTYWAERDYQKSAEYYQSVFSEVGHDDFDDASLSQFACERLCDSLIFVGRYREAARIAVSALRSQRASLPAKYKARLYARIAYAFAEERALKKAAIACLGLSRAAASGSDELDALSSTIAGWVLQHFDYNDPAIAKIKVEIRDSSALSDTIPREQVKAWRDQDAFKSKGMLLVATLFDLLGDLRRSELLYQRALDLVEVSPNATKLYHETAYVYLWRIARIKIRRGKFRAAAQAFRSAIEHVVDVRRVDQPELARPGPAAYALIELMERCTKCSSDADLIKLFEALGEQFASNDGARAWLVYRESEILFERLMVQAAKRRLAEAVELARCSSEVSLYWTAVEQRLFVRLQQIYSRWPDWLRDALDVASNLASDDKYQKYREPFAKDVQTLSSAQPGTPMSEIASVIDRFKNQWNIQSFCVAAYGLWRTAASNKVLASSRNEVEAYLRKNCGFLLATDFQ